MIRACEAADEARVLAAADVAAGMGPRLWVDWRLSREVPNLPSRFYLAGDAVLEVAGPSAWVYGPVADGEELASFFTFAGVDAVTTAGCHPPGWQAEPFTVMLWGGAFGGGFTGDEALPGFEENPAPGEVAALLAEGSAFLSAEMYGRFYADLCIRLNRGYAALCGVREAGRLMSTAGVHSLTPNEAHISGVETRPAARGRGYAAALVRRLCVRFADRRVSLACRPALVPYYEKLGFQALQGAMLRATAPRP